MKPGSSYGVGKIYSAVVKKVKKDKIFFDIKLFTFNDSEAGQTVKKAAFFTRKVINENKCAFIFSIRLFQTVY